MSAAGGGRLGVTPSQTIGPFHHGSLELLTGEELAGAEEAIRVGGRILDGEGEPVADAMVETWQAGGPGAAGLFRRVNVGEDGQWSVVTLKPPAVEDTELGAQAPHIDVAVFARGVLKQLTTRIYFADEEGANAGDPILARIDADRRELLVAAADDRGYRLDIRLQGERETPFLDF